MLIINGFIKICRWTRVLFSYFWCIQQPRGQFRVGSLWKRHNEQRQRDVELHSYSHIYMTWKRLTISNVKLIDLSGMYLEPKSKRTPLFYYLCCSFSLFFSFRWLLVVLSTKAACLPPLLAHTHICCHHIFTREKSVKCHRRYAKSFCSAFWIVLWNIYMRLRTGTFGVCQRGGVIKVTHFYCRHLFVYRWQYHKMNSRSSLLFATVPLSSSFRTRHTRISIAVKMIHFWKCFKTT